MEKSLKNSIRKSFLVNNQYTNPLPTHSGIKYLLKFSNKILNEYIKQLFLNHYNICELNLLKCHIISFLNFGKVALQILIL